MAALVWLTRWLEAARGRLFVWAPVLLGCGIGIYFRLPVEPSPAVFAALAALALGAGLAALRAGAGTGAGTAPLFWALALVAGGVVLAGARTAHVAAPVLEYRYYGPVEGRIVAVDRSQSDALRLTLDRVRLERMAPEKIPERVRISLHGEQGFVVPEPGMVVATTAYLGPPGGPVEPGGFSFRRMAWFKRLGAVGYTRAPVLEIAPAGGGAGLAIERLRGRISMAVRERLPGEAGAFAAALTTGDRSGISRRTLADLRASNLAHLLAISGLHMGLLTGFVFAAARLGLALIPGLALRLPVKKIAALLALAAGAFYLVLSGGNVATQRAFIMVAAMLVALLFDRRALTLRAVALAALIVLLLRPESLTEPGFQMSFAATTALVAVFGALREWQGWRAPRWARPALTVLLSSAVAGLATAPFSAATFNQVAHYGLLANLLAVPLMGVVVMPAAVLAALLTPLGLGGLGLALMRPALEWIMWVAHWVSGLEGAVSQVVRPGPMVVPLIALGGLGLALGVGRWRWLGLAPMLAALAIWANTERPALLVSGSGGLVGVMGPEGRVLNKPRGEGFVAGAWLAGDGDGASQEEAYARPGARHEEGAFWFGLGRLRGVQLRGRGAPERVASACAAGAELVILSGAGEGPSAPGCRVIDSAYLAQSGALAFYPGSPEEGRPREVRARSLAGQRPWNSRDSRDSRRREP